MSELACFPFGVGHSQDGVCLEILMGPRRILLDCGLTSLASLAGVQDRIKTADFLFCSHAHSDHGRGILEFNQAFPEVPIYGSEVTAQLLPLNWLGHPDIPPHLCHALPWHTPVHLADDLTVQIWPAGHLPGAACALFTYTAAQRPYTLFYSGDFFIANSRLVDGLPLEALRGLKPDVLIIEGNSGTARHPHRRQQENQLASTINSLLQAGRSVLLPTPTLGIGQELAMLLRSHHQFTGKDITVWVDPIVATGCDLYLDLLPYFPNSVQNFARHQPLFWDERILPRIRRLTKDADLNAASPCIVIGHRETDLSSHCRGSNHPWTVLLPESFAANMADTVLTSAPTEGGLTLDWLQTLAPELEADQVQLDTYLLTTHGDCAGTTQLIHNLRPQHVVFIHGKPADLADLASLEELQTRYQLHLPSVGNWVDFPIGDRFLQPAAPEPLFEGEITQVDDSILMLLSEDLATDPRWRAFADTGLVQARWQGDDLVIKSVSQQDLLRSVGGKEGLGLVENCQRCRFLRDGRCRNSVSSLYGFQVSPDGYCPAFEAQPKPDEEAADSEASA